MLDIPAKKVVFSNGCFDVIHRGHIELLKACRGLFEDTWVIVGLNSDESVRRLKGAQRPINTEQDRKAVLEAISYVDQVIIFNEDTPYELIKSLKPDAIVKGGDWKPSEVAGGDIAPVYCVQCVNFNNGEKYSTTSILEKLSKKI